MTPLDENWETLIGFFPAGWKEMARATNAVVRLRGFTDVEQILRAILLHVGRGWGLKETAVHARLAGIANVSSVTLMNRLRDAELWLRGLCEQLFRENGVCLQPAVRGRPVRVVDATTVKEPGKTGSQWRVHYSLRLPNLECDYFELTPVAGKNNGEKLGRFRVRPGELIFADAGYSHPQGVAAIVAQEADVCVRWNPRSMPLWSEDGRTALAPLEALKGVRRAGQIADWPVQLRHDTRTIAGRVCVLRKSRTAIWKAQRKITRKRQQNKSVGGRETRRYACYVMVFTTLPRELASGETVMECYRLRWQIELAFKRLKSIMQFGHVPKQSDHSGRAWLYAKLFVALLAEKLTRVGSTISPWGYPLPRQTGPS
jgi:hypothetical protein